MKTRRAKLRIAAIAGAAVVAVGLTTVTHFASAAEQQAPAAVRINLPPNIRTAVEAVSPGPDFVPIAAYQVGLIESGPLATEGTQTYTCDAATGTWPSRSTPEADLVKLIGSGPSHIHHYGGPSWSAPLPGGGDGSTVVGVLPAAKSAPQDDTIPWLLLEVTHSGPAGAMDRVARINRVLTDGGLPPAGACTAGQVATVPYGAVYVFWAPKV